MEDALQLLQMRHQTNRTLGFYYASIGFAY